MEIPLCCIKLSFLQRLKYLFMNDKTEIVIDVVEMSYTKDGHMPGGYVITRGGVLKTK